MGIAAWLVWREGGFRAAGSALVLFLVQLALNALWSWLFFGWHRGAQAFADILLLWALILATLVAFWRIRPLAGVLLLPYLLWVSFAAVLNYSVWQLNPEILGQDSSYSALHAQPVSALIRSVDEKNIAAILGIDYSTFIHIPS
jgi:tryptophan-rich sensory protein